MSSPELGERSGLPLTRHRLSHAVRSAAHALIEDAAAARVSPLRWVTPRYHRGMRATMYMRRCLALAEIAASAGDTTVGALIVCGDEVVGEGMRNCSASPRCCVLTRANLQVAMANYVWHPGDAAWRALALNVLRIEEGIITEIVTFAGSVFQRFGLPLTIDEQAGGDRQ